MATLITGPVSIFGPDAESSLQITATYDPADRWNGFVAAPRVDRETAEKIIAWLSTDPSATLAFDGPTLVYTTDPGDPEAFVERIDPDADGLYAVGLGWVWEDGSLPENDNPPTPR